MNVLWWYQLKFSFIRYLVGIISLALNHDRFRGRTVFAPTMNQLLGAGHSFSEASSNRYRNRTSSQDIRTWSSALSGSAVRKVVHLRYQKDQELLLKILYSHM